MSQDGPAAASVLQARSVDVLREDLLTGERHTAIRGLDLDVAEGERIALVGANGAGKTSLLLACVAAVPFTGELRVCGLSMEAKNTRELRSRVGFVFADPSDQLFCDTIAEEVRYGPRARGLSDAVVEERAARSLEQVGLLDSDSRSPHSLSFGEQRRLALATALACDPELLLLDEPTASLDGRARRRVLEILRSTRQTALIATHDLDFVLDLGARVVILCGGVVVADGPADVLLYDLALLDDAGLEPPLGPRSR